MFSEEVIAGDLFVHANWLNPLELLTNGIGRFLKLTYIEHFIAALEHAVRSFEYVKTAEVKYFFVFFETKSIVVCLLGIVGTFFLVTPSVFKIEFQKFLVIAHTHFPFLCDDDVVLKGILVLINHDLADAVAIIFLFAYFDGKAWNLVIKNTLFDIEGRFGYPDVVEHGGKLQVRNRHYIIWNQECQHTDDNGYDQQGAHEPEQGDSSRFDRNEFEALSQVAEGHDGGNQDGKGECQWYGSDSNISGQFKYAGKVKAFSYQVINVLPKKLHHQHEKCDEEGRDEWTDECF